MKKEIIAVIRFLKKETVLVVAWILAIISMFIVSPSAQYLNYIDFRSLGILWGLMVIMQGLKVNGVFEAIGMRLLSYTRKVWQLFAVLIVLCFLLSMLITNDVVLITFVPFSILMLKKAALEQYLVPVIVLQTIAANLGSMLTPIGNPQNLYLYGVSGMELVEFVLNMFPYTALSAGLLLICLLALSVYQRKKGVSADEISLQTVVEPIGQENRQNDENGNGKKKIWGWKVLLYLLLFIVALFVVLRVLPCCVLVGAAFLLVLIMERKVLIQVDYALLFTFVGFFVFTGNMGQIPAIRDTLQSVVSGREIVVSVLSSQCISNVPAALLLSGFSQDYKALVVGTNLGGLGTLIASMASLISYKIYVNAYSKNKTKYLICFTVANILFLIPLVLLSLIK